MNNLALMLDLEIEGQIHFSMTSPVSDCKHHTDMIFMPILTVSRPGAKLSKTHNIIDLSKT